MYSNNAKSHLTIRVRIAREKIIYFFHPERVDFDKFGIIIPNINLLVRSAKVEKVEIKLNKILASATLRILSPLIRILLRNGVPFKSFADLARWAYVDVAFRNFGIKGRKQSTSRVSILTGLSRKEVSRLRKMEVLQDIATLEKYSRAARVISGWISDRRFTDKSGQPVALPFKKGEASFSDLVKNYSGDVPSRAGLDELLQVGLVEVEKKDRIRLLTRAYVPRGDEPQMLSILGTDVSHLITTIDHNITDKGTDPFFQRKVSYDNVPEEALPELRELSAEQGQQLLEKLNKSFYKQDRDVNPSVKGSGRYQVGVGIYYFEESLDEERPGTREGGEKQ